MPTLDAFDPTQYYIDVSKTLEKLGYDVYLRGLCLLCDDGGWENVFFVVPRVNHRNPLVGGEFTVRLDMSGRENGNAALVRTEFSIRRVAATSGDSSLVREFEDESSRGSHKLTRWVSEVTDVSGGVVSDAFGFGGASCDGCGWYWPWRVDVGRYGCTYGYYSCFFGFSDTWPCGTGYCA